MRFVIDPPFFLRSFHTHAEGGGTTLAITAIKRLTRHDLCPDVAYFISAGCFNVKRM